MESHKLSVDLKIRSLKAITSPVKKIPREVMSMIFQYCHPVFEPEMPPDTNHTWTRLRQARARAAPLSISYVCHGWRSLVLSTPELWSRIEAYVIEDEDMNAVDARALKQEIARVARYVGLSKSCPLACQVTVEPSPSQCIGSQNLVIQLLDLFSAQSGRWEYMSFVFPRGRNFTDYILQGALHNLPYLRYLRIHSPIRSVPSSRLYTFNAPMLKSVTLHSSIVENSNFPWAQLTTISVKGSFNVEDAIVLLKNCSSLRQLSLVVHTPLSGSTIVTLPQLESLTVRGIHTGIASLLGSIAVPRLRMLSISFPPVGYDTDLDLFMTRLSSPLESLELGISEINHPLDSETLNAFIRWLRLVPSLKTLSLVRESASHARFSDAFALALTPGQTECICPRLESLKAVFDCSLSSLVDMIEKRWHLHLTRHSPGTVIVGRDSRIRGDQGEGLVSRKAMFSKLVPLCNAGLVFEVEE